jgi:hypothetical protein
MTLLKELKRRKVLQATFGYILAATAILVITKVLADGFGASDRIFQIGVVVALMIFPFAVWLAWTYDLKPEGVEATGRAPEQTKLALPWHRVAMPITASVLILTGSLAFFSLSSGTGLHDENLVAVLPFRVSGTPDIEYLRNGAMELLAANMVANPRAADPGNVLSAYARVVIDAQRQATVKEAEHVARAVNAGNVIMGSVVGTAAHFTMNATLISFVSGRTTSATVQGSSDSLEVAVARLAEQLVAGRQIP